VRLYTHNCAANYMYCPVSHANIDRYRHACCLFQCRLPAKLSGITASGTCYGGGLFWLRFGQFVALIASRVALKLMAADPASPFAVMVDGLSYNGRVAIFGTDPHTRRGRHGA
jgi:hypothetical protein